MSSVAIGALKVLCSVALPAGAGVDLAASAWGRFTIERCSTLDEAVALLAAAAFDAVLIDGNAANAFDALARRSAAAAIVIVDAIDPVKAIGWLQRGAQDVMATAELATPALAARLRAAIERQRIETEARKAYAIDLQAGLTHGRQLVEHLSQLLALREREPKPMALIVVRIEGFATVEAGFGREAANVLRRKAAVRLRAGVRASDVVAALDDDSYAVLLGSLLAAADGLRVAAKLEKALLQPFALAGADVPLAVALGIVRFPEDGTDADALLRRAIELAAGQPAHGRSGMSNFGELGGAIPDAANDA